VASLLNTFAGAMFIAVWRIESIAKGSSIPKVQAVTPPSLYFATKSERNL
jgi:hypothetical protein